MRGGLERFHIQEIMGNIMHDQTTILCSVKQLPSSPKCPNHKMKDSDGLGPGSWPKEQVLLVGSGIQNNMVRSYSYRRIGYGSVATYIYSVLAKVRAWSFSYYVWKS